MDPITLTTLITSIATLLMSISNRIISSKCFGDHGVDIEFANQNQNPTTPQPH
jgi:hypothetical protein